MDLGRKIQLPVPVQNQTGGKVDDATAHRWAIAAWRSVEWSNWAFIANEDQFFIKPNLGEPEVTERVFSPSISEITEARKHNARVDGESLRPDRIALVVVRTDIRQLIDDTGGRGYEYGWIMRSIGPGVTRWIYADGRAPLVRYSLAAGATRTELVAGHLHEDQLMGEIWQVGSDVDCDGINVRSLDGCYI
jgi:hypothetical protein